MARRQSMFCILAAATAQRGADEDPAVAAALWAYQTRRAVERRPAEPIERWGVSLGLDSAALPSNDAPPVGGGMEPPEHRS